MAVKAVIIHDGKILLIKRRENDVHKPGQWDMPGGRLEIGEDPWQGVMRETKEEAGLEIKPLLPFDLHHFTRDDGQIITMIFFLSKSSDTKVGLSEEHTEYIWADLNISSDEYPEWIVSVWKNYKKIHSK